MVSRVLASFSLHLFQVASIGFKLVSLLFIFFILRFLFLRFFRSHFLSSDVLDVLVKRKGGFMVFNVHPFNWGCVSVLRVGEHRAFSSEILSRGLSPEELFIHNFTTILSNVASLPVNVSLVIRKVGGSVKRFIVISSRGIFFRRLIKRVKMATSTLSSYFSSLGFQLESVDYNDIGFLLERGVILMPKVFMVIDPSKSQLVKIDSTVLMSVKNLIVNSPVDYTLILSYGKFPKVSEKVNEEENGRVGWESYSFGVYYYFDFSSLMKGKHHQSYTLNSILNSLLPVETIRKVKREWKVLESSISQFLVWSKNNVKLQFDSASVERNKLWVFTGFLVLMLGSVEEEVLPKMLISDDLSMGDILVGYQLSGRVKVKPFYINLMDLTRHLLIVGPTGAGKTTLTKIIVNQILNKANGPSVWVFDFHGEYEFLKEQGFIKITPGRPSVPMGLNIFDSGSEDPEVYSNFLSSLLSGVTRGAGDGFSPQMERIISAAIHDVVFSDNDSMRNPLYFLYVVNELCDDLSSEIPSAKYSLHAIFNRLKTLFSGVARSVFWVTRTNLDMSKLVNRNIIFDLSYFSSKEPTKKALWILVNVLLRYLYSSVIGSQELSLDKPKIFIVLEEARYVAPAIRKEETATMYAAEDLAVLGRKYGVSLCFITQTANTISRDVIDNSGTIFMMGDAPIEIIKDLFTNDDAKYLQIMPSREALVKMSTRSVLTHIKLLDHDEISKLRKEKSEVDIGTVEYIRNNYKPIKESYEEYIRRLITRAVSLKEITV